MNPYRFVTVAGDARTWHTPIIEAAVDHAVAAGIPLDLVGTVLRAKGTELQLGVDTAIHPEGPREERMSRLWIASRHRYHDDAERTAQQDGRTRQQVARWAFNHRRATALTGGSCDLPENRWAIHAPLLARRYMEWRGLDIPGLLFCIDDDETFKADLGGNRVTSFSCTLGDARIDSSWRSTEIDVPIEIPHTLDAGIVGHPVARTVQHPVLDHPDLVVSEVRHLSGRTRLVLERAWTTLGDAP